MANYTYKDVCYDIPSFYEERFEEKHNREFDSDPNYNGDYWIIVGEYISDLEKRLGQFHGLLELDGGSAIEELLELSGKMVYE